MYVKTLFAGWGDMDFNAHMRNTAYLDKSAARVTSLGGWLDLTAPLDTLLNVLGCLPQPDDFEVLSTSLKEGHLFEIIRRYAA
jgi:acyl-CoA thioester hydrolase